MNHAEPTKLSQVDDSRVAYVCAVYCRFIETIPESTIRSLGIDEKRMSAMARSDIAARLTEAFFTSQVSSNTDGIERAIYSTGPS